MALSLKRASIILSISFLGFVCGLQLIPERAYIVYQNPKYVENVTIEVRRYGRNSLYYVNTQGVIKHDWNNNVTFYLKSYEFLHNEYKRSFVEIRGPICNVLKNDILFGPVFRNAGVACPIHPGLLQLKNLTLNIKNFPYKFPFSKGLFNMSLEVTKTSEVFVYAHVYALMK